MRLVLVPLILAAILAVMPTAVYANSNQVAAEKIAASLGDRFPGYDIAVSYQNGKVKLVGQVGSLDMMHQAIEIVKQIPGIKVTDVDNGLRVAGQPVLTNNNIAAVPALAAQQQVSRPQPQVVYQPQPLPQQQPVTTAPVPIPGRTAAGFPAQQPQIQANNQSAVKSPVASLPVAPQQPQIVPPEYAQYANQYGNHYQIQQQLTQQQYAPQQQYAQQLVAYQSEAYGPQGPLPGQYNDPNLPDYAWPSYAAYPNYAEVCYPKQYSPKAWPYIGPFYPYPQAPLGWRKTTLEWHDGWWWLDFDDGTPNGPFSPLFRQPVRYTY